MRIEVIGRGFLDFDGLIEMEKQIKLVEDISTSDGDFSYSFELEKTIINTEHLGNPQPDNFRKQVYQRIEAHLVSESGAIVYKGFIRVEKITEVYECSFFSGNNIWFSLLTGDLTDLDLSEYDTDLTLDRLQDLWPEKEGMTFPLIDHGPLITRSFRHLKIEDFLPAIYIKTIFEKIFKDIGVKLEGELIHDWTFCNTTCLKSGYNKDKVQQRSVYAGKKTIQTFSVTAGDPNEFDKLDWDTDSQHPFFVGSSGNWDLANGRYTADVKMNLEVEAFIEHGPANTEIQIWKNGVYFSTIGSLEWTTGPAFYWGTTQGKGRILLEAGDYIEIYMSAGLGPLSFSFQMANGWLKITPVYLYHFWGSDALPDWTKQDFVRNVLRLFNCLPSYRAGSRTLTINLFEKIKDKPAIDLSEYISDTEIDYTEFISNYGQQSKLSYGEVTFPDLEFFDPNAHFKYAKGVINVNNDFIESEADIVESDFAHPIAYEHPVFRTSLEKTGLLELEERDSFAFTAVEEGANSFARFTVTLGADDPFIDEQIFPGDLVRIENTANTIYNGDWVVYDVGQDWVELRGLIFSSDIETELTRLEYVLVDTDEVFLFINIPGAAVVDFSPFESYHLDALSAVSSVAFGYFDLIQGSEPIHEIYKYSLSFGGNTDPRQFQITMTERYFGLLGRVLNDPVKLIQEAHLPLVVYEQIDFLQPVTVRTLETTNRYYMNRISGYQESYLPCTLELIKLP